MNIHNPELIRQHQAYVATRARLWNSRPAEAPEVKALELERFEIVEIEDELEEIAIAVPEAAAVDLPVWRPTIEIINEVLANFPGITWADLKGARRTRNIILPRHLAMHAVYTERKNMSLPMIGRLFGGRDHTTILSAVRKVELMKQKAAKQ
jgi:chromosomal replication initiation ATPase DnaA